MAARKQFASKVVEGRRERQNVTREVDGGLKTCSCCLPANHHHRSTDHEPRYASMPNIMKSRKKPIPPTKRRAIKASIYAAGEILQRPSHRCAKRRQGRLGREVVGKLKKRVGVL